MNEEWNHESKLGHENAKHTHTCMFLEKRINQGDAYGVKSKIELNRVFLHFFFFFVKKMKQRDKVPLEVQMSCLI